MRNCTICSLLLSICFLNFYCSKPSSDSQSENPYLTSDKKALSEIASAGSDTIKINSSTDWSIINLPSWINASTMNGSKGVTEVILQYSANEFTNSRAGDISIKSSDQMLEVLTIHFSQDAASFYLRADKTEFLEDPAGQMDSVTITSNCSWTFDPPSAQSGIVADKTSGDAGTTKVHFALAANKTSIQRITDINIQSINGSALSINLHFTQDISNQTSSSSTLPGNSPHTYGISFVYDNKIYYGLGVDASGANYSTSFDVYDPQTNLWSNNIPIASSMHPSKYASCFIMNNIVYMGSGAYNNTSDWWSYDPSKTVDNAWKQVASFYDHYFGGVAFTVNNKAYAGIPYKDGSLFQFNPDVNNGLGEWVKLNGLNFPAVLYSSQIVINNNVYIIGGQTNTETITSNCWKFDPVAQTITQMASAPVKFKLSPSFSLNGKGYVLTNGTIYEFNPDQNSWKTITTSPVFTGTYNTAVINGVPYAWTLDGTVYKLKI